MRPSFPFKIYTWLFIIPVLILTTCKKEDNSESPQEQDVIISSAAKILSQQQWQQSLVSIDSTTWTITMKTAEIGSFNFKIGDILIIPAGQGMIRRIESVKESGSNTIMETSQAAITDFIEKGKFEFKKDLAGSLKDAKIWYLAEGVKINSSAMSLKSPELSFTIEIPLDEYVTLTGSLTVDPSISGHVIINDYSLEYFKMEFSLDETFELTATTTLAQLTLEKEVELAEIEFPTFTIMVGPVPVIITPKFTLAIGASLDLTSKLSAGIIQNLVLTAGVEYKNGTWTPYSDVVKSFGHSGPSLSNTAEAKIYIKPQVDILFYRIVSPNLSTELYGLVEADLSATPWWKLYGGLTADIGVEIKIWEFTLADFNQNLFDLKFLVADAGGTGNSQPEASFTVQPPNGNTATTFHFDASGCTDPDEPSSSLNVRWDWNGDGTWDTPYSTTKAITKQFPEGTHFIIMEVKDNVGITDTASCSLQVEAGNQSGEMTDPRDGHSYSIVQIGGQWWMAQNLNYGTMILGGYLQKDNGISEKYCYDDEEYNCDIYGGLYQWGETMQFDTVEVTQGICPPGWHVPTVSEWDELITILGGDPIAGGALKLNGTMFWDAPNTGATNSSGFAAIGAGSKVFSNALFHGKHQRTTFWTSYFSKSNRGTEAIQLQYDSGKVTRTSAERREGISVRCIRN